MYSGNKSTSLTFNWTRTDSPLKKTHSWSFWSDTSINEAVKCSYTESSPFETLQQLNILKRRLFAFHFSILKRNTFKFIYLTSSLEIKQRSYLEGKWLEIYGAQARMNVYWEERYHLENKMIYNKIFLLKRNIIDFWIVYCHFNF